MRKCGFTRKTPVIWCWANFSGEKKSSGSVSSKTKLKTIIIIFYYKLDDNLRPPNDRVIVKVLNSKELNVFVRCCRFRVALSLCVCVYANCRLSTEIKLHSWW